MTGPKYFTCLMLLSTALVSAQNAPRTIAITDKSNVPAKYIVKAARGNKCSNITFINDLTKSDYTLEAIKKSESAWYFAKFDLTLFDRAGNTFSSVSDTALNHPVKELCHAIKTFVMVEVVDSHTLTQSIDARDDTSGGVVGAIVSDLTGRRTHTDQSSIYIILNGEHALLDCYERSIGCSSIGPGRYYGKLKGDGIWLNYRMPITHQPVRNHYKLAGSW